MCQQKNATTSLETITPVIEFSIDIDEEVKKTFKIRLEIVFLFVIIFCFRYFRLHQLRSSAKMDNQLIMGNVEIDRSDLN